MKFKSRVKIVLITSAGIFAGKKRFVIQSHGDDNVGET